jgi:hypothetical protein
MGLLLWDGNGVERPEAGSLKVRERGEIRERLSDERPGDAEAPPSEAG